MPEKERCPDCGLQRIGKYRYCPGCGHKYAEAEPYRRREIRTYDKCRDCRWYEKLAGNEGVCHSPGKVWQSMYSMYKAPTQKACRRCFERGAYEG